MSELKNLIALDGRWIAVNAKPNQEGVALANLDRQGFRTYLPLLRKTVKHARRKTELLRPLFPGYLFVDLDRSAGVWRPILSTYGVRSVVTCADFPSLVPRGFVEALQAREMDGAIADASNRYQIGQQVLIDGGPFGGMIATIVTMKERDRLTVLVDFLNQTVKTTLSARAVTSTDG